MPSAEEVLRARKEQVKREEAEAIRQLEAERAERAEQAAAHRAKLVQEIRSAARAAVERLEVAGWPDGHLERVIVRYHAARRWYGGRYHHRQESEERALWYLGYSYVHGSRIYIGSDSKLYREVFVYYRDVRRWTGFHRVTDAALMWVMESDYQFAPQLIEALNKLAQDTDQAAITTKRSASGRSS